MTSRSTLGSPTINDRMARCRRCKSELIDCEPFSGYGEYWHKRGTDCVNDGKRMDDPEVIIHLKKSELRARNRGARLASKHRPKK